jgi:hypothetical protein
VTAAASGISECVTVMIRIKQSTIYLSDLGIEPASVGLPDKRGVEQAGSCEILLHYFILL